MQYGIIYARFSPRPDANKSQSVEAQIDRCKTYCTAHRYALGGIYDDRAASGASLDNRPGLEAALVRCCERRGVLVMYSLSRLARSTKATIEIADRLKLAGADLASVSEQIDTTTAAGKMIFRLFAVLAEFERELTVERTTVVMRYHQANGRRMTRADRLPYGWMPDPEDNARVVVCAEEQATIDRICREYALPQRLRALGAISEVPGYLRIAKKLETDGVTCRGGVWYPSTIRAIVRRLMGLPRR